MRIKIDHFGIALILSALLLMLAGLITGCSSATKTTEIKDKVLIINAPLIQDTVQVQWEGLPDTLTYTWEEFVAQLPDSAKIQGTTETKHKNGRKTKVKAIYYPKRDTLIVEAEQTDIPIIHRDTTQVFNEKKVPLTEKLGWGVIVLVIIAFGFFLLKKFFKF